MEINCVFICLQYHFKDTETESGLHYLNQWRRFNHYSEIQTNSIKNFKGVTIEEMSTLEQCFNLKINVVSMNSSGSVNAIYESFLESENVMFLNNYQNHLSYMTNYSELHSCCG